MLSITKKEGGRMWNGFIWHMIGTTEKSIGPLGSITNKELFICMAASFLRNIPFLGVRKI
jgi:hypothetical protein